MREVKLPNGNILHVDAKLQREPQTVGDGTARYQCKCHKMMGNDFWFLPMGSCIRDKGAVCDHVRVPA